MYADLLMHQINKSGLCGSVCHWNEIVYISCIRWKEGNLNQIMSVCVCIYCMLLVVLIVYVAYEIQFAILCEFWLLHSVFF